MYGKEIKFNKAFFLILSFVTLFASIGAYYSWNKAIELIGPNRASIFLHLMPVFGVILAIVLLKEKFQTYHFIGAGFIVSGIYLSNRKQQMLKVAILDDYHKFFENIIEKEYININMNLKYSMKLS